MIERGRRVDCVSRYMLKAGLGSNDLAADVITGGHIADRFAAKFTGKIDLIAVECDAEALPACGRIDAQAFEPPFTMFTRIQRSEFGDGHHLPLQFDRREFAARIAQPIIEDELNVIIIVVPPGVCREFEDAWFIFKSNGAKDKCIRHAQKFTTNKNADRIDRR